MALKHSRTTRKDLFMKPSKLPFCLGLILFLHAIVLHPDARAQSDDKLSLGKGNIDNQFRFVMEKSTDSEGSKIVKTGWLWVLKAQVADSLKDLKKRINSTQTLSGRKDATIDSLKAELKKVNARLDELGKQKDSMRFAGILMSKTAYNSLVWIIIFTLLGLMVIFIYLFKRSNVVTVKTKLSLEEVKDEFEQFRKKTLVKEQQIARSHLDEINKLKGKKSDF